MRPYISMAVVAATVLTGCADAQDVTGPGKYPVQASLENGATVSSGSSEQTFEALQVACGGELIPTTVVITSRWHNTQHPSGAWVIKQQDMFEVRGESASGLRLVGNGVAHYTQVFAVPQGGAFTYNSSTRIHLNVQGSADNYWFTVHGWWSLDANGVPHVQRFVVEYECRG